MLGGHSRILGRDSCGLVWAVHEYTRRAGTLCRLLLWQLSTSGILVRILWEVGTPGTRPQESGQHRVRRQKIKNQKSPISPISGISANSRPRLPRAGTVLSDGLFPCAEVAVVTWAKGDVFGLWVSSTKRHQKPLRSLELLAFQNLSLSFRCLRAALRTVFAALASVCVLASACVLRWQAVMAVSVAT